MQKCNKVLVIMCVNLYQEFWKKRCLKLHEPIVQNKALVCEIEVIEGKARNGIIVEMNKHV